MSVRLRAAVAAVVLALVAAGCGDDDDDLSADAGEDFSVAVGTAPEFDGCDSSGDIVNYRWTIQETPSKMTEDVGKALRAEATECSFTLEAAMVIDEVGVWTVALEVTDSDGNASSDTVAVEVTE